MKRAAGMSVSFFFSERGWNGLVIADGVSQNVKLLSAPKTRLDDLVSRSEVKGKSGVYVLTGPNSEANFGLEGYIGESDNLDSRLRSHAVKKPFWSRVYVAVSKDAWLSKSHIRFIEARLIAQAKRAPLLTRINNEKQGLKYDRLTEGEVASIEDFIGFLALIMPAIGCPLYSFPGALHTAPAIVGQPGVALNSWESDYFVLQKGAARAVAYVQDGVFWVCKGSTARVEEYSSLREGYRTSRRLLMERGILVPDDQRGVLVFTQDTPFNSPSDAAAVIGTTSLNGKREWKLMSNGASYSEWENSRSTK